jgi:tetratricopeptide (TPR) repeat protein
MFAVLYGPALLWQWQITSAYEELKRSQITTATIDARNAVAVARYVSAEQLLQSMNLLIILYISQARYDLAAPLVDESLKSAERSFGADSPELLRARATAGAFYRRQAFYKDAAEQYTKALEPFQHQKLAYMPAIIDTMHALAKLDLYLGRTAQAKTLYERALELLRAKSKDDQSRLCRVYVGLGDVAEAQGHYMSAESIYKNAIDVCNAHPTEAWEPWAHLSVLHLQLDEMAPAQEAIVKAQKLQSEQEDGMSYVQTDDTVLAQDLAAICMQKRDLARVQELVTDDLKQLQARVSVRHPAYGNMLVLQARIDTAQGQFSKALALYAQAQSIIENACGHDHRLIAELLWRRAQTNEAALDRAAAERDFTSALEVARKALPATHPQTANIMHSYANFLSKIGQTERAQALETNAQYMIVHTPLRVR